MTKPTSVQCPTCKKDVVWDKTSEFRPFCSKKCQMIDFGDWATEAHSIPGKPKWLEEFEEDNFSNDTQ